MSRIIVIGAGMGGMTAAARLAVKGHQVTVIEQAGIAGGKLGRYERDGFVFDTGPSLLTLPQVYRDFFIKTGQPIESALDIVDVEPGFHYWWPDGAHASMPGADTARCAAALGDALGGSAAEDWARLMRRAADMWGLTRQDFLEAPLQGIRPLLTLATNPRNIRTIAPFQSLRQLGQRTLRDSRLVTLLDRYATYTGSDPRQAPAALATIPYIEQTFGAHHISGGLSTLAAAVFTRCTDRGVVFKFDTSVSQITQDVDGRVTGIVTSRDEHMPADIVIANVDAAQVYGTLLQNSSAPRRTRDMSLSGFCIYAAVKGRTQNIAHHNVWFCDDYDDEFDSIFGIGSQRGGARPVPNPTIYACVPQDPSMQPADHEAWFILINAAPHGSTGLHVNWNEPGLADAYADRVLKILKQRGVDLTERILWRQIRTPADIERETGSLGGAIYGTASHGSRSSFTRPKNAGRVPGLYLVGGSAHPGGGLPLVGISGAIVAEMIGRA